CGHPPSHQRLSPSSASTTLSRSLICHRTRSRSHANRTTCLRTTIFTIFSAVVFSSVCTLFCG
ncbi:hypothetical protein BGZ98_007689, partial [Dissophora globulifera]